MDMTFTGPNFCSMPSSRARAAAVKQVRGASGELRRAGAATRIGGTVVQRALQDRHRRLLRDKISAVDPAAHGAVLYWTPLRATCACDRNPATAGRQLADYVEVSRRAAAHIEHIVAAQVGDLEHGLGCSAWAPPDSAAESSCPERQGPAQNEHGGACTTVSLAAG